MKPRNEVRCFCARHPLLATYGVGESGEPYLHVKVWKQRRIYADLYIDGDANCRLTCRECLRVHRIKIITHETQSKLIRQVMNEPGPDPHHPHVAPIPTPDLR